MADGLEKIEPYAFQGCDSLTEVHIPDTVTLLGLDAFADCDELTTANFPLKWKETYYQGYGDHSPFYLCPKLKTIVIPEGVTSIPSKAFWQASVEAVYFEGNAPTLSDKSFNDPSNSLVFYYIEGKSGWATTEWNGYPCYPVGKIPETETAVPVDGVKLDQTTATLNINVNADGTETAEELTLKATITPDNATDKTLTWETSDPAVLSIKGVGESFAEAHFIAKAPGTATVTVKTNDGGHTATCKIEVIKKGKTIFIAADADVHFQKDGFITNRICDSTVEIDIRVKGEST